MRRSVEGCRNPWNGKCRSTQIGVYIYYKGRQLPICRDCWTKIVSRNIGW